MDLLMKLALQRKNDTLTSGKPETNKMNNKVNLKGGPNSSGK